MLFVPIKHRASVTVDELHATSFALLVLVTALHRHPPFPSDGSDLQTTGVALEPDDEDDEQAATMRVSESAQVAN